jgi:threonine/homoserine/homoserine lactone efflux protein
MDGINLLLTPPTPNKSGSEKAQSWLSWATKGVYVSGLNPKVFCSLALLPQFIDTTASWSVTTQILAFGVVHMISCAIIYLMVGYGSEAILKTRPQAAQLVGRFSGGLMVVIATCLLIGKFKSHSKKLLTPFRVSNLNNKYKKNLSHSFEVIVTTPQITSSCPSSI